MARLGRGTELEGEIHRHHFDQLLLGPEVRRLHQQDHRLPADHEVRRHAEARVGVPPLEQLVAVAAEELVVRRSAAVPPGARQLVLLRRT